MGSGPLHNTSQQNKRTSRQTSYQLPDQNDYDRPEISNARYRYAETDFRQINHSAKTCSKISSLNQS